MNQPLISVIIPVYNVEKYILRCVSSVLNQTFAYFELLIIDDGSPDNSISLIQNNFQDERIKILSKKNGGLSDARNFGLQHAKGDYVWFIDSDDYVEDGDALSKLQQTILKTNKQAEIIVFNMDVVFENSNRANFKVENAPEHSEMLTGFEYIEKYNAFPYNAPTQCYKNSFLIDNHLFFTKGLYFEDIYLNLDIYKQCKSVIGIKENLYVYMRRGNSITNSMTNENHFISQAKVLQKFNLFHNQRYLPVDYLADRMQLEYERTKVYYKQSFQNLREETSVILKHIAIPTIKNELMADKLEKKIFYHFPFFVLNNKVLFRKIGSLEKIILNKNKA